MTAQDVFDKVALGEWDEEDFEGWFDEFFKESYNEGAEDGKVDPEAQCR